MTELDWDYPIPKQYPQIPDRIINYVHVQQRSTGFILKKLKKKHKPCRILKSIWCILLVGITKVKLPSSFRVYSLSVGIFYGYSDAPLGRLTEILDQAKGTAPPPY